MADLHPGRGDDAPNVGDHRLGEDFIDEAVVANEPENNHFLFNQNGNIYKVLRPMSWYNIDKKG